MDTNTANGDGPRAGRVGSEGGGGAQERAGRQRAGAWSMSALNTRDPQGAAFSVSKVGPGA
jgi:hypothetical protein